jgi:hypothetical protein
VDCPEEFGDAQPLFSGHFRPLTPLGSFRFFEGIEGPDFPVGA